MRRVLAGTALALVLLAPPGEGQERPVSAEVAARSLAEAWGRADAAAIESLLAPSGLTLRLDGQRRVGVAPRQARASIAAFLEGHVAGPVRVRRTEALGGDPPRALAELEWTARPRSTQEAVPLVIFVGLEQAEDGWVVSEIRVLS